MSEEIQDPQIAPETAAPAEAPAEVVVSEPAPPAEPSLAERLEADVKEAEAAIAALPAQAEAEVKAVLTEAQSKAEAASAHIDAFWNDVVQNVSIKVPTAIHNTLSDLKETLRSKILSLF